MNASASPFGYDPIYAHERWRNRQDSGWDRHLEAEFQNRRAHENLRPPRTWAAQRAMTARAVQGPEKSHLVAAPLDDLRRSKNSPLRFELVDPSQRRQFSQRAQEVQRHREERQKLEAGEYDWAHLAYSIWPERVREKCKADKSLAIAHDLEHLYIEPKGAAKKKGKPVAPEQEEMEL